MVSNTANIYEGNCGDLTFFYNQEKYPIENFRNDFKIWLEIRKSGGVDNNSISKESLEGLDTIEKIRIKRQYEKIKNDNIQGFHNFNSLIYISTARFIAEWLKGAEAHKKSEDHYKPFFHDLLTSESITYLYEYIGANNKKYKISADAVSLAQLVIEDLLHQNLNGNKRLVEKVRITETVQGFVSYIFKNEVSDFFNKKASNKTTFEKQLLMRSKDIVKKNYSKDSNISKYILEKDISFVSNLNGFSISRKYLISSQAELTKDDYRKKLSQVIGIISKKPKLEMPSIEKSTIDPESAETLEESEKKLNKLLHIESMWKVFSATTLIEILSEAAKAIEFVPFGLLNEAFKQALSTHHYGSPQYSSSKDVEDSLTVDDSLFEQDWHAYLTEFREFDLPNICEAYLYQKLEILKDENYTTYAIFYEYLENWIKLIQSNLDMKKKELDIKKDLKTMLGTDKFTIAEKLYSMLFSLVEERYKQFDQNNKIEEISFFSALLKYIGRTR